MSSTETDNSQQNNITQSDADTDDVFSSFKTEEDLTRDLVATLKEHDEYLAELKNAAKQFEKLVAAMGKVMPYLGVSDKLKLLPKDEIKAYTVIAKVRAKSEDSK